MASKADSNERPDDLDTATLVRELVAHAETLIWQQSRLLWSEVSRELRKTGSTALLLGAGAGFLAAGGVLVPPMLVHLLHRRTRLPLWSCYGLIAGALGSAGAGLLVQAFAQARQLHLPALPQTTESLQENLTWLKEQATSLRP